MLLTPDLFLVIKIGLLIIIFLFILFLAVILKQIRAMNSVVTQPSLFPTLHSLAWVMIFLAVSLFIATLVIL